MPIRELSESEVVAPAADAPASVEKSPEQAQAEFMVRTPPPTEGLGVPVSNTREIPMKDAILNTPLSIIDPDAPTWEEAAAGPSSTGYFNRFLWQNFGDPTQIANFATWYKGRTGRNAISYGPGRLIVEDKDGEWRALDSRAKGVRETALDALDLSGDFILGALTEGVGVVAGSAGASAGVSSGNPVLAGSGGAIGLGVGRFSGGTLTELLRQQAAIKMGMRKEYDSTQALMIGAGSAVLPVAAQRLGRSLRGPAAAAVTRFGGNVKQSVKEGVMGMAANVARIADEHGFPAWKALAIRAGTMPYRMPGPVAVSRGIRRAVQSVKTWGFEGTPKLKAVLQTLDDRGERIDLTDIWNGFGRATNRVAKDKASPAVETMKGEMADLLGLEQVGSRFIPKMDLNPVLGPARRITTNPTTAWEIKKRIANLAAELDYGADTSLLGRELKRELDGFAGAINNKFRDMKGVLPDGRSIAGVYGSLNRPLEKQSLANRGLEILLGPGELDPARLSAPSPGEPLNASGLLAQLYSQAGSKLRETLKLWDEAFGNQSRKLFDWAFHELDDAEKVGLDILRKRNIIQDRMLGAPMSGKLGIADVGNLSGKLGPDGLPSSTPKITMMGRPLGASLLGAGGAHFLGADILSSTLTGVAAGAGAFAISSPKAVVGATVQAQRLSRAASQAIGPVKQGTGKIANQTGAALGTKLGKAISDYFVSSTGRGIVRDTRSAKRKELDGD